MVSGTENDDMFYDRILPEAGDAAASTAVRSGRLPLEDPTVGLGALGVGIVILLWRSFFPSYVAEKGKNLATKEDIAEMTNEVERIKALYNGQLKQLEHQNSLLLEELRSRHQLRMAALEKRLDAHQHAFTLWRTLLSRLHSADADVTAIVSECQQWWDRHCLYLSPDAREAFNRAYFAAANHAGYLRARADAQVLEQNFHWIMKAGEAIVAGAELPSLGDREAQDATTRSAV